MSNEHLSRYHFKLGDCHEGNCQGFLLPEQQAKKKKTPFKEVLCVAVGRPRASHLGRGGSRIHLRTEHSEDNLVRQNRTMFPRLLGR